jgi:transposase
MRKVRNFSLGSIPRCERRTEVIPVIKRHEVQVLLSAGHSHRKVAKLADVSKRTVTRIAQEPKIEGLDEMGVARDRRLGRPSRTGEFREVVEAVLKEDPDLPTVEILHRLKLRGYQGGKSAVYELVKALRGPAPSRLMVRLEGLPGEFAQFDFGTGPGDVPLRGDGVGSLCGLPAQVLPLGPRGGGPQPADRAAVPKPDPKLRG